MIDSSTPGWLGGSGREPLANNQWHFFAVQTDYDNDNQRLWIFREGDGLLFYRANTWTAGLHTTAESSNWYGGSSVANVPRAIKLLESVESAKGTTTSGNDDDGRIGGYLDHTRFYNTILTPRNIQYLFDNPTGRPFNRPQHDNIAIKHEYDTFFATHATASDKKRWFYIHGYDVDGNPADVNPRVTVDGRTISIPKSAGQVMLGNTAWAGPTGVGRTSNTAYILYDSTNPPGNYYIVQPTPIGANTSMLSHDWHYNNLNENGAGWSGSNNLDNGVWHPYVSDDAVHHIVGEGTLVHQDDGGDATVEGSVSFSSIQVYQQARLPSVVRNTYNWNVLPDFIRPGYEWDWSKDWFGYKSFFEGYRTNANIGVWMPDAAIGTAFIANGAIRNAKIELASVNGAQIQTATINHAEINTVNADTITTGKLAAARIDVSDVITVGNIVDNANLDAFGYQTEGEVTTIAQGQGYQTGSDVTDAIAANPEGFADAADIPSDSDINTLADARISAESGATLPVTRVGGGTIEVALDVGGGGVITIDGNNKRIVIKD